MPEDEIDFIWDGFLRSKETVLGNIRELLDATPEPHNARLDMIYYLAKDCTEAAHRDGYTLEECYGKETAAVLKMIQDVLRQP